MKNSNLIIREATTEDARTIAKISKNDLGYACEDMLVKAKISALDKKRECVFVAEYENTVIGYVHVERYDLLYSETMANILGLAVTSGKRRLGAGRMLMSAAEDWARTIGANSVRLNSGASRTEAHKFYRMIGFNQEKEQIKFMKNI